MSYAEARLQLVAGCSRLDAAGRLAAADAILQLAFSSVLAASQTLGLDSVDTAQVDNLRKVALGRGDVDAILSDPYWEDIDLPALAEMAETYAAMRTRDYRSQEAVLVDLAEAAYGLLEWLGESTDDAVRRVLSVL